MTRLEERPGKLWHVGQMARRLRHSHAVLLSGAGLSVHQSLRFAFNQSLLTSAFFVDEKLAALVGISGTLLDSEGTVWLALDQEISDAHPMIVARAALRFVDHALQLRRSLVTNMIEADRKSVAFAYFLGFSVAGRVEANGLSMVRMSKSAPARRVA